MYIISFFHFFFFLYFVDDLGLTGTVEVFEKFLLTYFLPMSPSFYCLVGIYLPKVSNGNTRTMCELLSKKCIVISLLSTMNIFHTYYSGLSIIDS